MMQLLTASCPNTWNTCNAHEAFGNGYGIFAGILIVLVLIGIGRWGNGGKK